MSTLNQLRQQARQEWFLWLFFASIAGSVVAGIGLLLDVRALITLGAVMCVPFALVLGIGIAAGVWSYLDDMRRLPRESWLGLIAVTAITALVLLLIEAGKQFQR